MNRRRLNGKALGCFVAVVVVLGGGVHFLHGFQVRRNAGEVLEQGLAAIKAGDQAQATKLLNFYLAYRPQDTSARAELALMADRKARTPRERFQALTGIERVLLADPGRKDLRRRAVELAMDPSIQRFGDAQQHLKLLLNDAPDDGKLQFLLGKCYEATEKYSGSESEGSAENSYEKSIKLSPSEVEAYVRLANVRRRHLRKAAQADAVMDQLVKDVPTAPAHLARYYYLKEFKPAVAGKDLAQALKLAPEDADVLLALAEAGRDKKDYAAARKHLEAGVVKYPKDGRFYQALADIEIHEKRKKEAVDALRNGLKVIPDDRDLNWKLANLLLDDHANADDVIATMQRLGFHPAQLDYLQARKLVNQKDWANAVKQLEKARPDLSLSPTLAMQADYLIGQCYAELGDLEKQYQAYRRAVASKHDWVAASAALAATQAAMGKVDDALETYRRVAKDVPEAKVVVARLLLQKTMAAPDADRSWQPVEEALGEADRAAPNSPDVVVLRTQMAEAKGDSKRADELLKAARAKDPKRLEYWIASANLAEGRGDAKQALAVLREAEQQLGDRVELRVAAVVHWSRQGAAEARPALEQLEKQADGLAAAERARVWRALVAAYARVDDPKAAARVGERLAAFKPSDVEVRLALFDLALRTGDDAAMTRLVNEIRDLENPLTLGGTGTDGAQWRFARARQLLWQAQHGILKELSEARVLVAEVRGRHPNWARAVVCEGEIDEFENEPNAAFKNYQRAIDMGERNPELIRRVVQFLYDRRRFADAEQVIRKLPDRAALAPGLQRLAAQVSVSVNDFDRALRLAGQSVPADSKDYRDHLWLAQVRWAAGRQKEAEAGFRRAVAVTEKTPDAWVALVGFLARTDQKAKAEEAVREAAKKLPKEKAPLALGQCYELLGQPEQAKAQYEAALKANRDDVAALRSLAALSLRGGAAKEMDDYLVRIIALRNKEDKKYDEDAAWATRMLAIAKAARRTYMENQQALQLLNLGGAKKPEGAQPESIADRRVKAIVLAGQPDQASRRQAIDILTGIDPLDLTPDDQFVLARLYDSVGEAVKANQQMTRLLAKHADRAPFVVYHTQNLVRQKQLTEAELWLGKLEHMPESKGSAAVAEVKARLLAARGEADGAVAALQAFVDNPAAKPGDRTERLLLAAAVSESMSLRSPSVSAFKAAAEKWYREVAVQKPEQGLALASFLGRQKRTAEALDQCDRAWQVCKAEAVAMACADVLRQAPAGAEHFARVERRYREAMLKHPDAKASLMICLADLYDRQGQFRDSADVLRKLLKEFPKDATAMNNLAWLLAVHEEKYDEALGLIQQASERVGPVPALRDTRAVVLMLKGQAGQAVQELREVVEAQPEPSHFFHLARAYQSANDATAAKEALAKAVALGLEPNQLHILERGAYEKLREELKK